jgi:hypothetical protein
MTTRSRGGKKKPQWGGKREGAGRPALFPGKRVKMTIKMTTVAKDLVDKTIAELEPEHGVHATEGAAVEWLIRKATKTPME